MAIDVNKLIITQVDQITCFNNANELEFIMDELQDTTISNTEEKVDITGKGGRKIGSLKKNKAVTISGTSGVLVGGVMAAQTGSDIEQGIYKVRVTDIMTVKSNSATTDKKAVGTLGAEIGTIYKKNPNGSLGEKFTQVASNPVSGQFSYDPNTKIITLFSQVEPGTPAVPASMSLVTGAPTVYYTTGSAGDSAGATEIDNAVTLTDIFEVDDDGVVTLVSGVELWDSDQTGGNDVSANISTYINGIARIPETPANIIAADLNDGDEIVAFYDIEVESAKISNDTEKYSKTLKMYVDVTAQDNCDNAYHGQFIIQRADFSGNFDFTMGSDPTTQGFEAESLAGGCTGSTNLWDFIVY